MPLPRTGRHASSRTRRRILSSLPRPNVRRAWRQLARGWEHFWQDRRTELNTFRTFGTSCWCALERCWVVAPAGALNSARRLNIYKATYISAHPRNDFMQKTPYSLPHTRRSRCAAGSARQRPHLWLLPTRFLPSAAAQTLKPGTTPACLNSSAALTRSAMWRALLCLTPLTFH